MDGKDIGHAKYGWMNSDVPMSGKVFGHMPPKVLLIEPSFYLRSTGELFRSRGRKHEIIGLALPYLAAWIDAGWKTDLSLLFEKVDDVDYSCDVDLVMISAYHCQAKRANEIGDKFLRRGVPVVMGGYYPSLSPEIAGRHCTSLAIGEVEGVIDDIMRDFMYGKLKVEYRSPNDFDMDRMPPPRFDLINPDRCHKNHVQTITATRGCTKGCDYCSMQRVYGRSYKKRLVEKVVWEMMVRGKQNYFFVDDNLTLDKRYAKTLFQRIRGLAKTIIVNVDSTILADEELLEALGQTAEAVFAFIGLEAVSDYSICGVKGFGSVSEYRRLLRKLREHNIVCMAGIMVGSDFDDRDTFDEILRFVEQNHIPIVYPFILQAVVGSKLYESLRQEGRLLWTPLETITHSEAATGARPNFKPKNMTTKELEQGFWRLLRKIYSWKSIFRRVVLQPYKSPIATGNALAANIRAHFAVKRGVHPMYF